MKHSLTQRIRMESEFDDLFLFPDTKYKQPKNRDFHQ